MKQIIRFNFLFAGFFYLLPLSLNAQLVPTMGGAIDITKDWSAMRPAEIPLMVRENEYKRENIVVNHSFENGELLRIDTVPAGFKLPGWETIGKTVEWCDTALAQYGPADVSIGGHAIKISRGQKEVREINNAPSGVLSGFIPVIPGNYLFFLDVKLKNIKPAVERLNSKIGNGIDIHLEFYDSEKNRLSDGIYFEYYDKEIDNGFKGFAFSNLYYIDSFDWGKIRGRTLNYPFSEGDMPDACKFVKIFIGLKSPGTMWVDNVGFRLSKWNFTTLERMKPLFDMEFGPAQLVTPTPQQIEAKGEISLKNKKLTIVIPAKPGNADLTAAELIKTHLGQSVGKNKVEIIEADSYAPDENELAIQMRTTRFPKETQAYQIRKEGNSIILSGSAPLAHYYAATTFVQLIDKENKTYHHAYVYDFPDFKGRSYVLKDVVNKWTLQNINKLPEDKIEERLENQQKNIENEIGNIEKHTFYKLNKVYNAYGSLGKDWKNPGMPFESLMAGIAEKCKNLGTMDLAYMINPYAHFEYESEEETLPDSLRGYFSHSNPKDIERIFKIIDPGFSSGGANTIMLCADDFVPHRGPERGIYTLFTDADKKRYYNIAEAQIDLLANIKSHLDNNYPNSRIEFCPAPYLNQFIDYSRGSAEAYFRDISSHLPADIPVIWTGNTVRSLCYDMADIRRYTQHIGRKPMLWDNTIYARELTGEYGGYPAHYPGKAVMCNLFEPYDIIVPDNFAQLMDDHIYLNGNAYEERWRIKFATFADFAWNLNAYDPDFSLFKILLGEFGKDNALKLLQFNDDYYKLVSLWAEIRNKKEHDINYKPVQQEIELGDEMINNVEKSFKALKTIDNKEMLLQLEKEMGTKIENFHKIIGTDNNIGKKGRRQT